MASDGEGGQRPARQRRGRVRSPEQRARRRGRGGAGRQAPTYLPQESWLLPGRGRGGVAAEGGPGVRGLAAPEAVARVEALLLGGRRRRLPALLGPAALLPALPPAACGPLRRGRPRPRAVGGWTGRAEVTAGQAGAAPPRPAGRPGKGCWVGGPAPRTRGPLPPGRGWWRVARCRRGEGPQGLWDPQSGHCHQRGPHAPPSVSADRLGPFSRDFCFLSLRRWQRWWWCAAAGPAGARSGAALHSGAARGRCGASVDTERFMGLAPGAGCGGEHGDTRAHGLSGRPGRLRGRRRQQNQSLRRNRAPHKRRAVLPGLGERQGPRGRPAVWDCQAFPCPWKAPPTETHPLSTRVWQGRLCIASSLPGQRCPGGNHGAVGRKRRG